MTRHKPVSSSAHHLLSAVAAIAILTPGITARAQAMDPIVASDHKSLSVQLEAISERELKRAYLRCSREAVQRTLGFGGIASCSIVYETLLRRLFEGDFYALIAWSREQRNDTLADSPAEIPVTRGPRGPGH